MICASSHFQGCKKKHIPRESHKTKHILVSWMLYGWLLKISSRTKEINCWRKILWNKVREGWTVPRFPLQDLFAEHGILYQDKCKQEMLLRINNDYFTGPKEEYQLFFLNFKGRSPATLGWQAVRKIHADKFKGQRPVSWHTANGFTDQKHNFIRVRTVQVCDWFSSILQTPSVQGMVKFMQKFWVNWKKGNCKG